MAYGLTPEGFVLKDLQTIKAELESEFKALFGDDIDISDEAVFGQLIGNLSKKYADIWELLQAVYNNFNPDKAENISLDNASALVDVQRLGATKTEVIVTLYGNIGTTVPVNHLMEQQETEEQFELQDEVIISLSDASDITFSVTNVLNNQLYTVTVNGTPLTYTSDASATEQEIITGLVAAIDAGSEPVDATDNGDLTANVTADDGTTSFTISVDSNLQIDAQGSPGRYLAVNAGSLSVSLNTVTIIITPIAGLQTANNLAAGTTGRDAETDEELRIGRRRRLRGKGRATDEAIRARILEEVDNVTAVTVISNRSDITVSGRPPHSFETIVTGGDEQEIADKIWENQPSGIQPFGDITKTVVDSTGKDQTVKFSRPTEVYIWVDIDASLYTEEDFPANGIELIKQEIVEWALTEYDVGVDVIRQRLNIPIYSVPGIEDIDVELATSATPTGPPGAYAKVNVVIADDEIAIFDESRITVTIV